ncbi:MAG TPA: SDR family oxidoreductase [Phenylobacterium sp.]
MTNFRTLEGKVALVSGSGRGIGRAIALKLAGQGAAVVVNDLDEAPALQTAAMIQDAGGRAALCIGSVSEPGFGERFVQTALDDFDGLDIIVNNAGYTWDAVVQKMTDDQWDAILDVHLKAPFAILRAAQPFIRDAQRAEAVSGRSVTRKVVNISSLAGLYGNAGQANYAAAKMGVVGLTRALCKEWGRLQVTVNCVAYGFIETRLTESFSDTPNLIQVEGGRQVKVGVQDSMKQTVKGLTPLGRGGTPEEAAGAVYLFCIPESDYVSGQVLVCGGGLLI